MRKLILAVIALASAAVANSQMPDEATRQYASNYYAYPYTRMDVPALSAAPKGYEAFHIEHYGRHGSRWHIGKRAYNRPVETLEIAERNGKLTPRGEELLGQLRELRDASIGRDGELSPLGALQHRQIAQRMIKNFPTVFAGDAYVTARSSTVIRCILSMNNELHEFKAINPRLRITSDASAGDMKYIANDETEGLDTLRQSLMRKHAEKLSEKFKKAHPVGKEFIKKLIADEKFVKDSIKVSSLFGYLFNIAANAQSLEMSQFPLHAPYDLFTADELRTHWQNNNVRWFLNYGNSALTGNTMMMGQRPLMRNIIASVDTALTSPNVGANLRFGHEVILLPLAVLLELDDYGKEYNDLETLAEHWRNYEIYPMGSNIQLIFYRKKGDTTGKDVLVKALLNERECRMPATPVEGCYYRWADLKKYYEDKMAKAEALH